MIYMCQDRPQHAQPDKYTDIALIQVEKTFQIIKSKYSTSVKIYSNQANQQINTATSEQQSKQKSACLLDLVIKAESHFVHGF